MNRLHNLLLAVILVCLLVAGAQAINVNVSVYKHNFTSNETIPSIVTNMTLGAYYSQKATFYQYMKPGEPSELGNNNVTWPFAHKDEIFNMTNVGTVNNSVYIGHWWPPEKGGGYEELWFNGTSYNITAANGTIVHGTWNRTYHYEYDQIGTYISRWRAAPLPGREVVESTFWINGTKLYGPSNFTENTSVWSRNPSYVTLDYYENNTHAAHDWFTIDMDLPPTFEPGVDTDEDYPGAVDTGDTSPESSPTATSTSTAALPTVTVTGTALGAAPTGTVDPAGNASAALPTGDGFPYLWLLALLALIALLLLLFLLYRRRKDEEQ